MSNKMSDLKPFKHGQEGTHHACQDMIEKHGGKTQCCECTGHKCNPNPTEKRECPNGYPGENMTCCRCVRPVPVKKPQDTVEDKYFIKPYLEAAERHGYGKEEGYSVKVALKLIENEIDSLIHQVRESERKKVVDLIKMEAFPKDKQMREYLDNILNDLKGKEVK